MIGTLSSSCSRRNLMASRPRVMCRLSSDCAENPNDMVGVAVEAGAAHERHEQQVGEKVLEAERDGDEELERSGAHGVVEERLRYREVPDPVVHLRPAVEPRVVLVVVADRVD